jgi:hypothetical protein
MSVDWYGVAQVLNQIGKMGESSEVEKMETEYALNLEAKKEQRTYNEKQEKDRREFNILLDQVDQIQTQYQSVSNNLLENEDKMDQIGFDLSRLNAKDRSFSKDNEEGYGQSVNKIYQDLELSNVNDLRAYKESLELELDQVMDAAIAQKHINNNIELGKNLFKQGIYRRDDYEDTREFIVNDQGLKVRNPNFGNKGVYLNFDRGEVNPETGFFDKDHKSGPDDIITEAEYVLALNDILEIEKSLGNPNIAGIAEGFWSQYNEQEQAYGEHSQLRNILGSGGGKGMFGADGYSLTEEGKQLAIKAHAKNEALDTLERKDMLDSSVRIIETVNRGDFQGLVDIDSSGMLSFSPTKAGEKLEEEYYDAYSNLMGEDKLHLVKHLNEEHMNMLESSTEAATYLGLEYGTQGREGARTDQETKAFGKDTKIFTQAGFTSDFYELLRKGVIDFDFPDPTNPGQSIINFEESGIHIDQNQYVREYDRDNDGNIKTDNDDKPILKFALDQDGNKVENKNFGKVLTFRSDTDFELNMELKRSFENVIRNWEVMEEYISYEKDSKGNVFDPETHLMYGISIKPGSPLPIHLQEQFMNDFQAINVISSQYMQGLINKKLKEDPDAYDWTNK